MFDFLSTAGRCIKSHRLAGYAIGCIVLLSVVYMLLTCTNLLVTYLSEYDTFSINLFDVIEINASRWDLKYYKRGRGTLPLLHFYL